jgi:hypothetical protein
MGDGMNNWDIFLSFEGNTPNWRNIFSLEKSKFLMISFYSYLLSNFELILPITITDTHVPFFFVLL